MPHATKNYHNRLVVIFDFDGTLAPDAVDQLLVMAGEDLNHYKQEERDPLLKSGWDSIIAEMYCLLKVAGRNKNFTLTRESLKEKALEIELYAGVEEMFDQVRAWVHAIVEDAEVEFYLLSCGLVDMYRHTPIAKEFKAMWGSEFYFDGEGKAAFVKQVITNPEKIRYILQLAKGMGVKGPSGPADVYRPIPEEEWHVPLDQVIYVGDGASDMPAFSLMHEHGGIALGVVDADKTEDWGGYEAEHKGRRVQNLAKADYAEDSELMKSLRLSVESIAKVMALRKLSKGE
jgi:phosphoglycolate phosphatase-like HAD superfamily hydrolase